MLIAYITLLLHACEYIQEQLRHMLFFHPIHAESTCVHLIALLGSVEAILIFDILQKLFSLSELSRLLLVFACG